MAQRWFVRFAGMGLGLGLALGVGAPGCGGSEPAAASTTGEAKIGAPAPDFTLTDLDGKPHTLSSLKGKTVVLEWFNPGCPFVQHAHGEGGPLASLPAKAVGDGIVWIAINSGAPGKEGAGAQANKDAVAKWSLGYPVLLDEDGKVGRAYGAASTPHMYVVDKAGNLVYRGALDNRPLGKGDGAVTNYVEKALADLAAGHAVATADTKPYGCSVKY